MNQDMQINKNESLGYAHPGQESCITNCLNCYRSCTELIPHCLSMGGAHAESSHIMLLMSCAEACLTSAKFMMMNSEYHTETCRTCALLCARCADECLHLQGPEGKITDEKMSACAEFCLQCAESCRQMATSMNEH